MTDPAAHTPDVDTLAETVRKRALARRTHMIGSDQDWRGHFIVTEAELSDLAATARRATELEQVCEKAIRERRSLEIKEDDWHRAYERSERRGAELEAALRDAGELLRKTIYQTPGWTGPDVWWKDEADALLGRVDALAGDEGGA